MRYTVSDTDVNAVKFADIDVDADCDGNFNPDGHPDGFTDPHRSVQKSGSDLHDAG